MVELSFPMKLRIAAAAAVGVFLIGIVAWPLAAPAEPFQAVRSGNLDFSGGAVLIILGFLAGLIGYFVSWPYGREIGILAAPCGLAIFGVRSGSMASLLQLNPGMEAREALLAGLKLEPLFWLLIVVAGFGGVLCAQGLRPAHSPGEAKDKREAGPSIHLNAIIALAASVFIAHFSLGKLAQDVEMTNGRLGAVVGQPPVAQIVFGLLIAFGLAGFVVKSFLNAGYIWPIIAGALVTPFAIIINLRQDMLVHLVQHWPAAFFSNTVTSILPVQMVAFGTIGAIAGYWMGIRYDFWRKHEI